MRAAFAYPPVGEQGQVDETVVTEDISQTDPGALAKLMMLGSGQVRAWRPEELEAVYRHQMSAVVQFDLAGLGQGPAGRLSTLSASEGLLVRSFADLFQHPNPPIELLVLTKQFAKASIDHPDGALPGEVAKVLYFVSIAVALVRCGQRITQLDDQALRLGIEGAIARPWVDEPIRAILRDGLNAIGSREGLSP